MSRRGLAVPESILEAELLRDALDFNRWASHCGRETLPVREVLGGHLPVNVIHPCKHAPYGELLPYVPARLLT